MKKQKKRTCEICGGTISIILKTNTKTEKLCMRCLIAHYPSLEALEEVVV